MRNTVIKRYDDLSRYLSPSDLEDAVMKDTDLTNLERLLIVFGIHKERLCHTYPQLYCCALKVLDEAKKPVVFPFCDLTKLLGAKVMQMFSCGPYYYRLNDTPSMHLQVKNTGCNSWSRCSCQEIAAVVVRRDEIRICDES